MPQPPIDTRALFRPLSTDLVTLLRALPPADFDRATIAGAWLVRDVVAHIVDVTCRRVSFHRDRMPPPPPTRPINSAADFVAFINDINAQWVTSARRLSPHVLTDLADLGGRHLAEWFESLPLEAPALFGVSWAGEQESAGWFDVGREFAELWHHQQQIRLAVGAPLQTDARFLQPVLGIAMRALPHALGDTGAAGDTLVVDVTGGAHGAWTCSRGPAGWTIERAGAAQATTRARMTDDTAWRLLFHALTPEDARARVEITGRADLAAPLFAARAVIV